MSGIFLYTWWYWRSWSSRRSEADTTDCRRYDRKGPPMAGERLLWTGPYGADLRDYAMAGASADPYEPVAGPLAARPRPGPARAGDPIESPRFRPRFGSAGLVLVRPLAVGPWRAGRRPGLPVGRRRGGGLRRGGPAGTPGGRDPGDRLGDRLARLPPPAPGAARRLDLERASTRRCRHPTDPVPAAEWAVFVRYRTILRELGAEDAAGFAALGRPTAPASARPAGRIRPGHVPRLGVPDPGAMADPRACRGTWRGRCG